MGEVLYISVAASNAGNERTPDQVLAEAVRRFCRSIELCEGYLRGYYGLKMVSWTTYLESPHSYTLPDGLTRIVGYRPVSEGSWS